MSVAELITWVGQSLGALLLNTATAFGLLWDVVFFQVSWLDGHWADVLAALLFYLAFVVYLQDKLGEIGQEVRSGDSSIMSRLGNVVWILFSLLFYPFKALKVILPFCVIRGFFVT